MKTGKISADGANRYSRLRGHEGEYENAVSNCHCPAAGGLRRGDRQCRLGERRQRGSRRVAGRRVALAAAEVVARRPSQPVALEDVLERLMEVVYKYRTTPIADLNLDPRHDFVVNAVYMFYTPTSKHIRNAREQASIHVAELI